MGGWVPVTCEHCGGVQVTNELTGALFTRHTEMCPWTFVPPLTAAINMFWVRCGYSKDVAPSIRMHPADLELAQAAFLNDHQDDHLLAAVPREPVEAPALFGVHVVSDATMPRGKPQIVISVTVP